MSNTVGYDLVIGSLSEKKKKTFPLMPSARFELATSGLSNHVISHISMRPAL